MKAFSQSLRFKLALMFFACCLITACSDDNDNSTSPEEDDTEEVAQIMEKMQRQALVTAICSADTLDDGTVKYTSRYGKVLDETKPTVYYVGIERLEEAQDTWRAITSVFNESEDDVYDLSVVQHGDMNLSFSTSEGEDEWARIDVDCPELRNTLTSIVFIPTQRWPENDMGSPFLFMSVWEKDGRIYLCVRKAQGSQGILLTFDGGWEEDWFTRYTHWQGRFFLWKKTADAETFNCLASIMRYNSTKFEDALDVIAQKRGNNTLFHKLYSKLNDNYSITFDRHYTYEHHIWWAYNCYDVTLYKTTFYKNHTCAHWSVYYTRKRTPERSTWSHAVYFDQESSTKGWTCYFRGFS